MFAQSGLVVVIKIG